MQQQKLDYIIHCVLHVLKLVKIKMKRIMETAQDTEGIPAKLPIFHLHTRGGAHQAQSVDKEVSATCTIQESRIRYFIIANQVHIQ